MNLHKSATPLLTLRYIVKREERARHMHDKRRRPITVTASYFGADGHEYRKAFSAYLEPRVPQSGTHAELNAIREQW